MKWRNQFAKLQCCILSGTFSIMLGQNNIIGISLENESKKIIILTYSKLHILNVKTTKKKKSIRVIKIIVTLGNKAH
jgi:hypothetical protein